MNNYLDTEYDLSKVLFIATANNVGNISPALRDRMEMINIPGYILEDKLRIAADHLVAKQREAHGIPQNELSIPTRCMEKIIADYTRESGVRSLDKHIAKIARHRAKSIALDEPYNVELTEEDVETILGKPKFRNDSYDIAGMVGVVTGLAWTEVGGDILYIESILTPGKGKLSLTGNLGDVMKESATIAYEWVMAHHVELGIDRNMFEQNDLNIHVPEGAIPKDGPSAGITMLTSIVSTFTSRPPRRAHRHDRRDYAARPRYGRGRHQGEDPRRKARRHYRFDPFGGQPQGYRGDQTRIRRGADVPLRAHQRRSAETRIAELI